MRRVLIRFPIVVYPSEDGRPGRFTAHCLNMDVLADDQTVEGAVSKLLELIEVKLDAAEEYAADPFDRAPEQYWRMLAQAEALSDEVLERITQRANARLGAKREHVDIREQCDVRQVKTAA